MARERLDEGSGFQLTFSGCDSASLLLLSVQPEDEVAC